MTPLRQVAKALAAAKDTIREWHDMQPDLRRVMQADIDETWALYQHSPEMQQINAALDRPEVRAALADHTVLWAKGDPRHAFVSGAAWWEFTSRGATMWGSDRNTAEAEAERRYPAPSGAADEVTRRDQVFGAGDCGPCARCGQPLIQRGRMENYVRDMYERHLDYHVGCAPALTAGPKGDG